MKTKCSLAVAVSSLTLLFSLALQAEVVFTSPGLAPSKMDDQGRLVEDWGALDMKVSVRGVSAPATARPAAIKLDDVIPAAQLRAQYGSVAITRTAYRAPVWPAGLDVLTVRFEETEGREASVGLALGLPQGSRLGTTSVSHGGRMILRLPATATANQAKRDWGWMDDSTSLHGWAKPAIECDPAFRNIRAGLGGVPIHYRFTVEPRAAFKVVLGFCESHWASSGQRPVVCRVEGAPAQDVDPVARWGQHQPGVLQFEAKDQNGDGLLDLSVLPHPGAPDQNPILNAIWIFGATQSAEPSQVIAGKLNGQALRFVDVGGEKDQSLYAGGQIDYLVQLQARGTQEIVFLVACPGSTLPAFERTTWTPDKLRRSAAQVWREWKE